MEIHYYTWEALNMRGFAPADLQMRLEGVPRLQQGWQIRLQVGRGIGNMEAGALPAFPPTTPPPQKEAWWKIKSCLELQLPPLQPPEGSVWTTQA